MGAKAWEEQVAERKRLIDDEGWSICERCLGVGALWLDDFELELIQCPYCHGLGAVAHGISKDRRVDLAKLLAREAVE